MLEVTTTAQESALDVDFAELYKSSELCRYVCIRISLSIYIHPEYYAS